MVKPQISLYSVGNLEDYFEKGIGISIDGAREQGDAYEITAHP